MRLLKVDEDDPSKLIPTTFGELEDADKQSAHRARWDKKIEQVVRAYYETDKSLSEAAQKLAKLLGAYCSQPSLKES